MKTSKQPPASLRGGWVLYSVHPRAKNVPAFKEDLDYILRIIGSQLYESKYVNARIVRETIVRETVKHYGAWYVRRISD
jgi:hypothetical protein